MIDIVVIIAALLAFFIGYRRGFIVSLIYLVGLYLAILLAPSIAEPIGSMFMGDSKYLAFIAGFFLVIVAAMFILWFVAPILGKLIFLNPFKRVDKILGGVLNFVVMVLMTSGLFAAFDYANIGNINVQKVQKISADKITPLLTGDIETRREYSDARFVEFETLDNSLFFNPLASFGRAITPSVDEFKDGVSEVVKSNLTNSVGKN